MTEPANQLETKENESLGVLARQYLGEALRIILLSLAIILPVRYFLIQPFYVKGASMEPNFKNSEYLVIDELSYRFEAPKRGDIVVFRPPTDASEHFIKRVIGLPGEGVDLANGVYTIRNDEHPEGFRLDESAYLKGVSTPGAVHILLKDDEYFVSGDNRSVSFDSRSFGPIKRSSITGRVWIRGWPLDKIGPVATPEYAN